MMKTLLQERDTIYPRLYEIGKRLTSSFNQQAESLDVAAVACGYPYESPTLFDIHFLQDPPRPEHQYLWQTGPASFEDYIVKSQYSSNPQARYVNYLVMANSGIHPFASTSFFTCATYTEEDLQKTETAFGKSLQSLKDNKLIGRLR